MAVFKVQSTIKDPELLAQKRATLIEAAAKQFRKKGFDRTTIPDIAEAAGISVGSIYRYIGRKEDLMILMLAHTCELVEKELLPYVENELEPFDKLYTCFGKYCRLLQMNKDYFIIAIRDNRLIEENLRNQSRAIEIQIAGYFMQIINEGIEKNIFAKVPVDLISYNLVSLGQSWLIRKYLFIGYDVDRYSRDQCDLIREVLKIK